MKTCKVKPTAGACRMCVDTWEDLSGDVSQMPDCQTCSYNTDVYEIVDYISSFWGTSALLQKGGKLFKVGIDRIYDIKEG